MPGGHERLTDAITRLKDRGELTGQSFSQAAESHEFFFHDQKS
jgi:hypothetical protein